MTLIAFHAALLERATMRAQLWIPALKFVLYNGPVAPEHSEILLQNFSPLNLKLSQRLIDSLLE